MLTVVALLFCVVVLFQGCESDVKCRNDSGAEVDWYILYKLPNVKDGGLSYLYMDESTGGWRRSTEKINSRSGALANTLKPLLDFYNRKTEGFGYMLYNDQLPKQSRNQRRHTNAPSSFGHSKGGCSNVLLSQDNKALQCKQKLLAYSYDSDIPKTFPNELRCVAQRSCYPKKKPWFREKMLTSLNGQQFHSFAKYKRFGDGECSQFQMLKFHDLYVKSWGKMRGPQIYNCGITHHVYNVKTVRPLNMQPFSDTVDHSKWCVTPDGNWTCIADMNREKSQMYRGGGAICTNDVTVGEAFYALIKKHEPCEHEFTVQHREL
uniref:Deoxyribonuclease-2-alpha n=1 Tax=Lates calcarifer TaxID=8187 RepID=A0A4W6E4P2_LATCA